MAKRNHLGVVVVAGVWAAWCGAVCSAQSAPTPGPAPCSVAPQPEPCGAKTPGAAKPETMDKFPFPGNTSNATPDAPAAEPATPNLSGIPQAPDAGTPSVPPAKPDASKEFPFPGDASKPDSSPGAPASSSSSSSSSDDDATPPDSSGTPALEDKGSGGDPAAPGRHILHKLNPPGTKLQTVGEREAEDLSVAKFYIDAGDLQGAYLRSQDAVKTVPDDPDAHFALAEIALKLGKRDEAIAEYKACLKNDPSDKEVKESRKALARLNP
jgi:hypothetical protein